METKKLDTINIDDGIKKIVYTLNEYGFMTTMSCEGHLPINTIDRLPECRLPYPHISLINDSIITKELNKASRKYTYIYNHYESVKDNTDYIGTYTIELAEIKEKLRNKYSNMKLVHMKAKNMKYAHLHELIYQFNEKKKPVFLLYMDELRLFPMYADRQFTLSDEVALMNIIEMRKVFDQFADFIIENAHKI